MEIIVPLSKNSPLINDLIISQIPPTNISSIKRLLLEKPF